MMEHDSEPVRGLPGVLPEGEHVLWQGSPNWVSLAWRAVFARIVVTVYAISIGWSVFVPVLGGQSVGAALSDAAHQILPMSIALAIIAIFSYASARTTIYTITNRRVVLRYGVALQVCINVPLSKIETAALRKTRAGRGDIPLKLSGSDRFSYIMLWPHVRPWKLKSPEPMLRSVPDAARAAAILGDALRDVHGAEAPAAPAPASPDQDTRGTYDGAAIPAE